MPSSSGISDGGSIGQWYVLLSFLLGTMLSGQWEGGGAKDYIKICKYSYRMNKGRVPNQAAACLLMKIVLLYSVSDMSI